MEAYLTMDDLTHIRLLINTFNQFKNGRYGLEVSVTSKADNKIVGYLKQPTKNSEFAFYPASSYSPYNPSGKEE